MKRALEQLLADVLSDICPYLPTSPGFDPHRVLLRRLFFINSHRTKHVSLGFFPARDYQPLVEFGAIRRGVEIHRSQGRAYRHAGGLSGQDGLPSAMDKGPVRGA